VVEDVKNLATSVAVARKIYGVVLAADNLGVNWEATEKARAELRQERLDNAVQVAEWRRKNAAV